jgi:hypothetical protein
MFFFVIFGHQTLDPYPDSLEMLDPDPYPDPDSINPDPQHCGPRTSAGTVYIKENPS